jgi:hypothetical protein
MTRVQPTPARLTGRTMAMINKIASHYFNLEKLHCVALH